MAHWGLAEWLIVLMSCVAASIGTMIGWALRESFDRVFRTEMRAQFGETEPVPRPDDVQRLRDRAAL